MDEGELTELLEQATGLSLDCTIALLHQHAPTQATSMMIKRLEKDPYGNVSGLFKSLTGADLGQDSPTLLRLATLCLTSSHEASALAAADLLQQWIEAGNTLEVAPLAAPQEMSASAQAATENAAQATDTARCAKRATIYEKAFLGFSYGFRPGHLAIESNHSMKPATSGRSRLPSLQMQ